MEWPTLCCVQSTRTLRKFLYVYVFTIFDLIFDYKISMSSQEYPGESTEFPSSNTSKNNL